MPGQTHFGFDADAASHDFRQSSNFPGRPLLAKAEKGKPELTQFIWGKTCCFKNQSFQHVGLFYISVWLICQKFGLFFETTGFETTVVSPYKQWAEQRRAWQLPLCQRGATRCQRTTLIPDGGTSCCSPCMVTPSSIWHVLRGTAHHRTLVVAGPMRCLQNCQEQAETQGC